MVKLGNRVMEILNKGILNEESLDKEKKEDTTDGYR